MAESELGIGPVSIEDLSEVAALMRAELGEDASAEDLKWWFFDNPARGASIEVARGPVGVVGMATINDCLIRHRGIARRFGMPQKVLVAEPLRGKGLFGRLYWASEASALNRGVTGFLTFSNAASTPIFLSKFGYRRGRCPDILVFPWNVRAAAFGPAAVVVKELWAADRGAPLLRAPAGLQKDWAYFRWRYGAHKPESFVVLAARRAGDGVDAGMVVLKNARKGGLPVTLVMDFLARDEEALPILLDAAAKHSARRGAAALLALDDGLAPVAAKGRFHFRVRGRFNFLVKAPEGGEALEQETFPFSFGDLDFT